MATDRLGSILAFIRVAEQGSFADAGKTLGLSASAVSKSVARLHRTGAARRSVPCEMEIRVPGKR